MAGLVASVLLTAASATGQEAVALASSANRQAFRGETAGSLAGLSLDRGEISAADTRRDLIVGAPAWNSNTGRVYIVFSGPVLGGEQPLSNADVIITGGAAGDRLGEATAAGFVTAQEATLPAPTRDLIVGAPAASSNAGAVYLFQRGFTHGQHLTPADALVTITGAPAGARLGAALATGDLDGDGYREIIIGAPGIGAVYVIHGGAAITGTISLAAPSAAFFTIQGSAAAGFGTALAAGDMIGHAKLGSPNTIYDLAIGAPNESSNTGAVYIIEGRTTNSFPSVVTVSTSAGYDARYTGIDAGDFAGKTLQIAAIDSSKPQYAALLIGAPLASGPANGRAQAGEIYIMFGGVTLTSKSASSADVTIYGAVAGAQEGTALAFGDVSRDGTADFVSLAPAASSGGEIHMWYGRPRASWPAVWDMATMLVDRYLYGNSAEGPLQSAVVYDLTGEGFDDIAGGIPTAGAGLVYVSYSLAPVATQSPFSYTVNPNSGAAFTAVASGSPAPRVQWQVSTNGTTWTNISGATAATYTFVAQASDTGKLFRAVFTNSLGAASSGAGRITVRSMVQVARRGDVDGDGRSDLVLWRASTGQWLSLTSGLGYNDGPSSVTFGSQAAGDIPLQGDVDGDGVMDIVVWRPSNGTFYWRLSSMAFTDGGQKQWGSDAFNDVPMLADMDGDGRADLVIWRPTNGTFYWLLSSSGYANAFGGSRQWGSQALGDKPLLGDFDGDGKADVAVWRASNGTFYWCTSSSGYTSGAGKQWGSNALGDQPFLGDFDGDGKADVAVWRASNGTWYWATSSSNYTDGLYKLFGSQSLGDVPLVADIDGDGRTDMTIWRASTGTWYWVTSSSGYTNGASRQFGSTGLGDVPMLK